jgi:hypothetical protein
MACSRPPQREESCPTPPLHKLPVLSTDSLSAFGHAFASCAFCNTCSLLSSRNIADPISRFQPAASAGRVPIAVRPIAARRNAAPPTGLQRDSPTRPSQSLGRGPVFDFWLLQPAVASPPIFPSRLPPLPCPLLATPSVAAWSRPKLTEDRVVRLCPKQQSSGGSIRSRTACLLWRGQTPWNQAPPPWIGRRRATLERSWTSLVGLETSGHPCRVLARHQTPQAAARPAPASGRLPASSRVCSLALLHARL